LLLKITEDDELIVLEASGAEVAHHHVAQGQHQRIIQAGHYQGLSAFPGRAVAALLPSGPRPAPVSALACLLGGGVGCVKPSALITSRP
jgi:hypothetical protein